MSSVVICAYTTERWGQLQEAVESVATRSADAEIVIVVDHADDLLEMCAAKWPQHRVVSNQFAAGLVRRPQHGCRPDDWRCHCVPRRRCHRRQRVARCADCRVHRRVGRRRGWPDPAGVGRDSPGMAAPGVLVGRRMQLRRTAVRSAGDSKPDRGQHGVHPVGLREGGRFPRGDRQGRLDPAGLRGDRAVDSCSSRRVQGLVRARRNRSPLGAGRPVDPRLLRAALLRGGLVEGGRQRAGRQIRRAGLGTCLRHPHPATGSARRTDAGGPRPGASGRAATRWRRWSPVYSQPVPASCTEPSSTASGGRPSDPLPPFAGRRRHHSEHRTPTCGQNGASYPARRNNAHG